MKKEMLFLSCLAAVSLTACSEQAEKKESTLLAEELKKEGQLIEAQFESSSQEDRAYYYIDTDGDKKTAEYIGYDTYISFPDFPRTEESLQLRAKVFNANQTKPKMPLSQWQTIKARIILANEVQRRVFDENFQA